MLGRICLFCTPGQYFSLIASINSRLVSAPFPAFSASLRMVSTISKVEGMSFGRGGRAAFLAFGGGFGGGLGGLLNLPRTRSATVLACKSYTLGRRANWGKKPVRTGTPNSMGRMLRKS